ncbi:uncharacterized protein LOC144770920 [Lissotriton helveticus]
MSWQEGAQAQIIVQDASVYFSDEEWRRLQEWQKELYGNVMKEIHQALMSLGPLISSTVISVRAKEKPTVCPTDEQDLGGRHINKGAMKGSGTDPERLLGIKREETPHLKNPQDSDTREIQKSLSADCESLPMFIDPVDDELEKSSTDLDAGEEIISFCIKDEPETYCIDHLNSARKECIQISPDDECINTENEATEIVPCTKATAQAVCSLWTTNTETLPTPPRQRRSTLQLSSGSYWEEREQNTPRSVSGFSTSKDLNLNRGRPRLRMSQKPYQTQSNLKNSLLYQGLPNAQQNQAVCTEFDTNYSHEGKLLNLPEQTSPAKGHSCTECGLTFPYKAQLFKHYTTHTGKKSHVCEFCYKSFSRKYHVKRHMRMHTGEKPYACAECGKRFTWKESCNLHETKHVGEVSRTRKIQKEQNE